MFKLQRSLHDFHRGNQPTNIWDQLLAADLMADGISEAAPGKSTPAGVPYLPGVPEKGPAVVVCEAQVISTHD